jgi:EAL domain-containing protein (putative c-di-GMP-specific phosphodiesterase class I)/CheY-like chemotaxis protein
MLARELLHQLAMEIPTTVATATDDISPASIDGADALAAEPARAGRVLVVDDEPAILRAYVRILSHTGMQVDQAANGVVAIELVRKHRYDAVVSDISMPQMSGIELLRAVHEVDADLPVILVTAAPTVDTATQAVEHGAMRYLSKPVDSDSLRATVESAVRAFRMVVGERQSAERSGLAVLSRGRLALEARLNAALGTLSLVYQPIHRSANRIRFGYEALVRTKEPSLPHPGALFAAGERLGRLHDIGRAIRASVAQTLPTLASSDTMFVNLHPHDLMDAELYSPSAPLSGFSGRVVLELTERAAVEQIDGVAERLARLRRMGYRLAIDDLGAGYAGLTSLAQFAPELVKIDMSLVQGASQNRVRRRLIESIIAACHDLGTAVVAEGIEDSQDRDALVELGSDFLQGYLLGRPAWPPPATVSW